MRILCFLWLALLSTSALAEVNLRFSPLGVFSSSYNLILDVPVSEKWTVGPMLGYQNDTHQNDDDGYRINSYTLGVRANYYTRSNVFTDGWYLGPSLRFTRVAVKKDYGGTIGEISGHASGVVASTLIGYQWLWNNFNINLGIGPAYYALSDIRIKNSQNNINQSYDSSSGLQLDAEFTLGWKF